MDFSPSPSSSPRPPARPALTLLPLLCVPQTVNMMISLYLGHFSVNSTLRDTLPIAIEYVSPFSSMGKPETCREYYLPGFHYCRIDVFRRSFRYTHDRRIDQEAGG